jgi:anti-sigma-K factor RskA
MSDDLNQELAALAALDLLEGEQVAQWQAAIQADPSLVTLEAQLRAASAELAHLAPQVEPPASLRRNLMVELSQKEKTLAPVIPLRMYVGWAAAACFAVIAAFAGRLVLQLKSDNALLLQEQRVAEISIKSLKTDIEAGRIIDKQTVADLQAELKKKDELLAQSGEAIKQAGDMARFQLAALTSTNPVSPKSLAVAVWDPLKQKGMLEVSNLPAAGKGKDYQLWVIDPQYKLPVDAGVFHMDEKTGEAKVSFQTKQPIRSADKFAVSVEKEGGAVQHEGPIILFTQ